ncbi:MAG: TetR/AcrR family transcriptional regulator [Steroidobacteraceae bacterium]
MPRRPAAARPTPDPAPTREARGSRRRRETRGKLLRAAFELMARRGMDGVAVNEITEAADVGFGSFYNHFESKDAIHDALVEHVFEGYADALDRALAGVEDPAEVMAASVRHTLRRAEQDDTWARFLIREALSERMLQRGLGLRLLRDIRRGQDSGRFTGDDELVALLAVAGTTLTAISVHVQHRTGAAGTLPAELRRRLGLPGRALPERVALAVLRFLGVPDADARRIARRALPPLEPEPPFDA